MLYFYGLFLESKIHLHLLAEKVLRSSEGVFCEPVQPVHWKDPTQMNDSLAFALYNLTTDYQRVKLKHREMAPFSRQPV